MQAKMEESKVEREQNLYMINHEYIMLVYTFVEVEMIRYIVVSGSGGVWQAGIVIKDKHVLEKSADE